MTKPRRGVHFHPSIRGSLSADVHRRHNATLRIDDVRARSGLIATVVAMLPNATARPWTPGSHNRRPRTPAGRSRTAPTLENRKVGGSTPPLATTRSPVPALTAGAVARGSRCLVAPLRAPSATGSTGVGSRMRRSDAGSPSAAARSSKPDAVSNAPLERDFSGDGFRAVTGRPSCRGGSSPPPMHPAHPSSARASSQEAVSSSRVSWASTRVRMRSRDRRAKTRPGRHSRTAKPC